MSYGHVGLYTHCSMEISFFVDCQVIVTMETPDGHNAHINWCDLQDTYGAEHDRKSYVWTMHGYAP